MPTPKVNDPFARRKTRHPGITYRLKQDGSRTYSVWFEGRFVKAGSTQSEALARQADLRGKAARGEQAILPGKTTFEEAAEAWYENKRKIRRRTRENYRASLNRVLIPRFGEMKIGAVNVDDIAALISDLERSGAKPSTINNHLLPLQQTLAFAMRRGLIGTNPYALLTPDDRPAPREKAKAHVWSDDDIAALIESSEYLAKQPESRYDYSPLIRTAVATGLRQGELHGLRWRDIDLHEGVLRVDWQWARDGSYAPPKTPSSVRRIPLSAEMTKYMTTLKLRSKFSRDDDPVFASRTGSPLSHRNVTSRGFSPAAKRAELNVSIHDTRHAFASRMISRGVDVVTLSELMGHKNPRITLDVYSHMFDRAKTDEAVRKAMGTS